MQNLHGTTAVEALGQGKRWSAIGEGLVMRLGDRGRRQG